MADPVQIGSVAIRRGNRAQLPVLPEGQFGYCLDTKQLFIGHSTGNIELFAKGSDGPIFNDGTIQIGSTLGSYRKINSAGAMASGSAGVTGPYSTIWTDENSPIFASTNGYQKLQNSLIIQWGTLSAIGGNAANSVVFPIAFPNEVFSIVSTPDSAGDVVVNTSGWGTTTGFIIRQNNASNQPVKWLAIGH